MLQRFSVNATDTLADRQTLEQLAGRQRPHGIPRRIVQEVLVGHRPASVRAENGPGDVDPHGQIGQVCRQLLADFAIHELSIAENAAPLAIVLGPMADNGSPWKHWESLSSTA